MYSGGALDRRLHTFRFYNRSPLRLGSVLSSSCLFMFGSQVEEQRYLLPAHSHFITVSHCITAVDLLQCCLLIADSAHCCSSRSLVWNAIICSPQLLSFSSDLRLVGCYFQGVLSVNMTVQQRCSPAKSVK